MSRAIRIILSYLKLSWLAMVGVVLLVTGFWALQLVFNTQIQAYTLAVPAIIIIGLIALVALLRSRH